MKYVRISSVGALFGLFALLLVISMLQGCATAGQPVVVAPKDFAQTELVTMSIASEVLTQADILLAAGVIKPADARSLVVTDPKTAEGRIALALRTIQGVRDYLLKRGATFSSAATG